MPQSQPQPARRGIFFLIRTREDALNVVTDATVLFLAVAALLIWTSFPGGWQNMVDAGLYVLLGLLMWWFKSPAAAFALLLIALMRFFVTMAQLVDVGSIGWVFVAVTVAVLFGAIRSVEATLKLIGRFAEVKENDG